MGSISRGFMNAFRNNIRTLSVVLILSVSIAMSLVMYESLKTVQAKIADVKSSIGNYVTVSPAGIRGFEGGGNLLTQDNVAKISQISGVSKTVSTLTDHLQSTTTNLVTPVEAGNFGRRQQQNSSSSSSNTSSSPDNSAGGQSSQTHSFSMPIMVSATSDLSSTQSLNMSQLNITSGEKFANDSSENIALLGTDIASKNNLAVGGTFTAYSQTIKVVGIFDGGNTFSNALIVMPLASLQTLSGQTGQINSVLVQTTSIDTMPQVSAAIKTELGSTADVTSSQDTSNEAITPLQNIKSISTYALFGSLIAGAIILFLTMVMIVRERRREIGVLKAIGASNFLVVSQFAVESLVLTLMSAIVGIIIGTALTNPILKVMATNSTSSASTNSMVGNPGQTHTAMMRAGAGIINGAGSAVRNLQATVGWQIILYGLLAAVVIAIFGSVIPSFIISKVRPAEVLRSE
ncbi:MAG: FtsX-like permease family protein [Candidatus Berkelbacteria bacterium]|nr:FtsX-like permease family protein [Candidatus Berkelbacteria bacterium]